MLTTINQIHYIMSFWVCPSYRVIICHEYVSSYIKSSPKFIVKYLSLEQPISTYTAVPLVPVNIKSHTVNVSPLLKYSSFEFLLKS
jgi:hypothetical protein